MVGVGGQWYFLSGGSCVIDMTMPMVIGPPKEHVRSSDVGLLLTGIRTREHALWYLRDLTGDVRSRLFFFFFPWLLWAQLYIVCRGLSFLRVHVPVLDEMLQDVVTVRHQSSIHKITKARIVYVIFFY